MSLCFLPHFSLKANSIDSLQNVAKNIDSVSNPSFFIKIKSEIGRAYIDEMEDYANAIESFNSALQAAKRMNNTREVLRIEVEIGEALAKQGKHTISVERLKKVIAAIGNTDLVTKAKAIRFLAMNNIYMGDYAEAYKYQLEALSLYTQLNDTMSIVRVKVGIGKNLFDQRQYDKAIEYVTELLPLAKRLDLKATHVTIHLLIGEAYLKKNQLEQAFQYISKALFLSKMDGDKSSVAWSLYYLGLVKARMKGNSKEAVEHLEAANKQAREYADLDLETETLHALADIFLQEKKYDTALKYLQQSEIIAKKENLKPVIIKIYRSIADIYYEKNDIKQYKIYNELYDAVKDSTVNEKLSNSLSELKQNFEFERLEKEVELSLLKKDNELQRIKSYSNGGIIIAILIIGLLIILLLYIRNKNQIEKNQILEDNNRNIVKRNEILAATNRDLEQYAHLISHDLKEPLRNIGSFSNLIKRRLKDSEQPEIHEYLTFITKGVKQMDDLLQDLLLYSKIGNHKKNMALLNIENIIADVIKEKDKKWKETNAQVDIPSLPTVYFDKYFLKQIFNVLLDNAIKFRRNEPPLISINYEDKNGFYQFSIKDNGIGIEEQYFEKIFIIFKRIHDRSKYSGTSIGLATCKKILEENGGKIWVESTPNVGSTFYFNLPKQAA